MDRAEIGAAALEKEPTFETALARLAEIVEALEKGDLPLERSLALFEEGIRLSRLGAERLENAELRVEQLLANSQTKILALDPSAKDRSAKDR
jgi:exodeoxyribonuclease VII small subunit